MISDFRAGRPKVALPKSPEAFFKTVAGWCDDLLHFILRPLTPYEPSPRPPAKDLPEQAGIPSEEQLAQCQAVFDQSEARRAHIEQKAQWAFTVIAFLVPSLASVLVFLLRDPAFQAGNNLIPLSLLSISAFLLFLSFLSAARALAIGQRESLFLGAILGESGAFRKYNRTLHAQGLLYCAINNQAQNDHLAEFVKGAHVLVALAVITFAAGAITTGVHMNAPHDRPIRAEVVGPVSLSPADLAGLRTDMGASAEAAASGVMERQLKPLAAQMEALEAEVHTIKTKPAIICCPKSARPKKRSTGCGGPRQEPVGEPQRQ